MPIQFQEPFALGRIRSIFKRELDTEITWLELERLCGFDELPRQFQSAKRKRKYWIDERDVVEIQPADLRGLLSLRVQRHEPESPEPSAVDVHVTEILYSLPPSTTPCIRPSKDRHLLPAEMHRPQLAPTNANISTLKIFLDIYVDDFGPYRSVFHSLGGVYVVTGNQPLELRQKLRNIHLIGFVPFAATFEDFIRPIVEELVELERGVRLVIDGVPYWVVIGVGVYTADLPQGNDLASVKRHNAEYGCRTCLVPQAELGNVDFDTVRHGRYHQLTNILLAKIRNLETQAAQKSHASKWGLALGPPHPLDQLAVDRHTQTPHDPAHLLLQNLTKQLITGTLDLLNPDGASFFLSELTKFEFPIWWSRFQNPFTHIKSYFFSDFGRLMMIGPFLIDKLQTEHFSNGILDKMKNDMKLSRHTQVLKNILDCWTTMASANALCFSSHIEDYTEVDRKLYDLGLILVKVFPYLFQTRPSFHALRHLGQHARRFGTLRNVSVASKEMVHRIFKNVVPATNKHDLSRDFIMYESVMQALRFITEGWHDPRYPTSAGGGLQELVNAGLFGSAYIQSNRDSFEPDKNENAEGLICDATVSDIQLHGHRWTSTRTCLHGLPLSPLTDPQVGELGDAYKEQGDSILKLSRKVSYFDSVSYKILGADVCDGRGVWKETGWVKVSVRVGDVLEVLSEVGSRSFVKVLGIMLHGRSVFFVVAWLEPSGQHHPRFHLPEYTQKRLFAHAAFFSLKTVDHPRFVNQTAFHALSDGKLVRNDWILILCRRESGASEALHLRE